jgi:hypothetical protein
MLRTGFDTLRTNGAEAEMVTNVPFVLSPSKHEHFVVRAEPRFCYAPPRQARLDSARFSLYFRLLLERNLYVGNIRAQHS